MVKRYKRRRRLRPIRAISIKRTTKKTQKLVALGVIFIFGLIMLISILWLLTNFSLPIRINISDVAAMRIPPKEIVYIYELCAEQQKDPKTVLTTYLMHNRFFREKQSAKSKEQLQMDFLSRIDSIRNRISEKQFNKYYALIETLTSEMRLFPVAVASDYRSTTYMFGDTWSAKREMCGSGIHRGTDIFDRENLPGRLAVVSMTGGTVEDRGKNGRGGMYIGIRTERGTYYLYDNLERLGETLEAGVTVSPGTLLGYMGNGGRVDKNQIKGKYPTNVHIGIKARTGLSNKELWINPYPFLRLIEERMFNEIISNSNI